MPLAPSPVTLSDSYIDGLCAGPSLGMLIIDDLLGPQKRVKGVGVFSLFRLKVIKGKHPARS